MQSDQDTYMYSMGIGYGVQSKEGILYVLTPIFPSLEWMKGASSSFLGLSNSPIYLNLLMSYD